MKRLLSSVVCSLAISAVVAVAASAAPTYNYYFSSTGEAGLPLAISSTDALEGNAGTIDAGGFHPASSPGSQQALTDGQWGGGVTSILADFSRPSLQIEYSFANPIDIQSIDVFSGNNDERVFQTYDVEVYHPGDLDFSTLLQDVHTGPFATSYAQAGSPTAALTVVHDDAGAALATNVSSLRFTFYDVGNTQNFYVDPWDIGEPRNSDGYNRAISGTVIKEIDVNVVPEPGSLLALGSSLLGFGALVLRRRG